MKVFVILERNYTDDTISVIEVVKSKSIARRKVIQLQDDDDNIYNNLFYFVESRLQLVNELCKPESNGKCYKCKYLRLDDINCYQFKRVPDDLIKGCKYFEGV